MFLSTILLALIIGALLGGGLPRLADLHLRWSWLLLLALGCRAAAGIIARDSLAPNLPLGLVYIGAYLLILAWLWGNWRVPGLQVAAVGIGSNVLAVLINGGQMPIWSGAFYAAGFTEADILNDPFHFLLHADTVAEFVARGGLFGDVIPLPIPIIRDVVSIGDVLLALGIFWAIVYSMTRADIPTRGALAFGTTILRPGSAGAGAAAAAIGAPYSEPALIPGDVSDAGADIAGIRRQSPYLRLVRNRDFGLLWIGQLVSLMGERLHTIALGWLVFVVTGSAVSLGLTMAATAVPNVILGSISGALVDRWDRRRTMLICDTLRGALLIAVPPVAAIDINLVYLMAFLIATVTLFFRPAKTAVIPAIVADRDLVAANSMSSLADNAADLLGFPAAGVLIAVLVEADALGLAFVIGGVTYLISAILIFFMRVPAQDLVTSRFQVWVLWNEIVEGWRFLRRQAELRSNTLFSTLAQVAVGGEIVAILPYAKLVLDPSRVNAETAYALLLAAIAFGSIVGGVAVGAIGERVAKGHLVIVGFVGMGIGLVAAGMVTDPFVAIGFFALVGFFNMLYIVPTITLFQERTPQRLMGRVVSSRQVLVFSAIAGSMAVAGWLTEVVGADVVLVWSGAICAVAGLLSLIVPSMRDAR